MNENDIAELVGIDDISYLGEGNYGVAYSSDDKVLKITNDVNEFCVMSKMAKYQKERLERGYERDDVFKNMIEVHNTWMTDDGQLVILMEKLDTDGMEDLFNLATNGVEYGLLELFHLDEEELAEEGITDERSINFLFSVSDSMFELRRAGVCTDDLDVSAYNVGVNKAGNFVLFDQRNMMREQNDCDRELSEMIDQGYVGILSAKKPKRAQKKGLSC